MPRITDGDYGVALKAHQVIGCDNATVKLKNETIVTI